MDLGIAWPDAPLAPGDAGPAGPPPRRAGERRGARAAGRGAQVAPEAVDALDRLVLSLEQQRYARPPGDRSEHRRAGSTPRSVRDAEIVTASLFGGATAHARRRATWWPASVLPWRRRGRRLTLTPQLSRHGGVVDHVG